MNQKESPRAARWLRLAAQPGVLRFSGAAVLASAANDYRAAHETEPQRDLPAGYQQQLDQGYAFGSVMTFAQRPLLTAPEQLDAWQPDVAIVGAPFDLGTTNRPGRPVRPSGAARQRLRVGHVPPQLRAGDLRPRRGRRLRRRALPARHGADEPRQHQEPSSRDRQSQDHPVHDGRRPHRSRGRLRRRSPMSTATATSAWSTSTPTPTPPTPSTATWPATARRCAG